MHEELLDHIHRNIALTSHSLTYGDGPTGSHRLKEALSGFLNKHLKPFKPMEPSHVTVTNGCSPALEHLSWAFGNPGDGFLLGQPWYGSFIPDISLRPEVDVVPVPFHDKDPLSIDAVRKYEDVILKAQAKGQRVAGLMLCHPHNPLGRCYPRHVLIGLMQLCEKYKVHLVSDEIYALSTFRNQVDSEPPSVSFESILTIDPQGIIDPARIHVVWGMSKDFGANGMRLGCVISQYNESLHNALVQPALYSVPSGMSDHAAANILEDDAFTERYIKENQRKLSEHHRIAATWARENDIEYKPGVNAAFFLWVNLGQAYRGRHPDLNIDDLSDHVMQVMLKQKVWLASGVQFGAEEPGWFRIVFSHQPHHLHEGLRRVVVALQDRGDEMIKAKL
jgi:aspartate/methionine/tyrosine aminotransferase